MTTTIRSSSTHDIDGRDPPPVVFGRTRTCRRELSWWTPRRTNTGTSTGTTRKMTKQGPRRRCCRCRRGTNRRRSSPSCNYYEYHQEPQNINGKDAS